MGRQALLVLDLINELVHPDGHYAHVCLQQVQQRGVVARAAEAVRSARAARIPVVHVVLGYSPGYLDWPYGSPLFGEPDPEHRLTLGTWGTRVHAELEPLPGEPVVTKHFPSSFRETTLLENLRSAGATKVAFAGMMTHMCVDTTVRAAADLGFECLLAQDGCATKALQFSGSTVDASQVQLSYLAALNGAFAKVQPARVIADGL